MEISLTPKAEERLYKIVEHQGQSPSEVIEHALELFEDYQPSEDEQDIADMEAVKQDFEEIIPPIKYTFPDGVVQEQPQRWKLLEPRTVNLKNIGDFEIQEIVNQCMHLPGQSMEERAKESLELLRNAGLYRPQ